MKPIRLVLADDHPLILEGFKSLLARNAQFEIAGEASDGKELLEMITKTSPDIVLTDINMPNLSGLEVMQKVLPESSEIRFIMLTMHEEPEYVVRCLAAGAKGYLLKSVDIAELANAIKIVFQGGKYYSPAIANILAESITKNDSEEVEVDITPREKEVLLLVSEGLSTKQIADKLGISIRTVETHRINLLKKLNVGNSAELVKKAIEKNLI